MASRWLCALACLAQVLVACRRDTSQEMPPITDTSVATLCYAGPCPSLGPAQARAAEDFFNARRAGWGYLWATPPGDMYTLTLTDRAGHERHFGVGRNFLRAGDAVRPLAETEADMFVRFVAEGTSLECRKACWR